MKVRDLIEKIDDAWVEIWSKSEELSIRQDKGEDLSPYYEDDVISISGGQYEEDNPFSQYVVLSVSREENRRKERK